MIFVSFCLQKEPENLKFLKIEDLDPQLVSRWDLCVMLIHRAQMDLKTEMHQSTYHLRHKAAIIVYIMYQSNFGRFSYIILSYPHMDELQLPDL